MNVRDLIPWSRSGERGVSTDARAMSPFYGLHREMHRVFDEFWRSWDAPELFGSRSWPKVDVEETDAEYRVVAELPGLNEKDVELTLRENVLAISGEQKDEREEKANGRYYAERFYGRFHRAVPLEREVDAESAAATFNNGVLTVILPKSPRAQDDARRIPIQKAN
jgi:HSP20 family protein